jgi:hypothetical protein
MVTLLGGPPPVILPCPYSFPGVPGGDTNLNGGVLLVTPCKEGLIDNGLSTVGGEVGLEADPEPELIVEVAEPEGGTEVVEGIVCLPGGELLFGLEFE